MARRIRTQGRERLTAAERDLAWLLEGNVRLSNRLADVERRAKALQYLAHICREPYAQAQLKRLNAEAERLRAELEVRQQEIAGMEARVAALRLFG